MPQFTQMILQAPPRRVEGFPDGNRKVIGILFVHRQLCARRAKIDPHIEWTTPAMVVDRSLDYHMTASEPSEVVFQILGVLLDSGPHCLRQREVARSNLNWPLHYDCPSPKAITVTCTSLSSALSKFAAQPVQFSPGPPSFE
jgi:hypothetical protein